MVQSCLTAYREDLKKRGHTAAYHLMNQPIEIQDRMLTISLINPVQENLLQSLKEELLPRLSVLDPDMTIQGILTEQTTAPKPYTDQEKLTYLGKKNAAITLLQERLMLEVAY
ncbi:hypothetical protein [Cardinium endosymbiont of Sogatella furcifera]|uniref:hypothetical protein n=1 Tax=Cardinium endosymbiont of Sogatella furcifera TaxID=650378 RepID=UPI000E0D5918|nr:hypothetical protein [Cardinium endosymbiont of Sogatella furcifera]